MALSGSMFEKSSGGAVSNVDVFDAILKAAFRMQQQPPQLEISHSHSGDMAKLRPLSLCSS